MQQNTQQENNKVLQFDLVRLLQNCLRVAKKLWIYILAVIVIFSVVVVCVQRVSYTPVYKSHYTFAVHVINKATLSDTNSLYAVYYDQDLAEQLDSTFSYLLNSDFLADDVKEYLGGKTIDGSIQANSIEGSNIFVVSAFSSTPEKSAKLLEAVMSVYYDAARYVLGDMETEIIEGPIVSQTPYNTPSLIKSALLGAGIGVFLCAAVLLIYALFRRTVFEPTDLENYINMQCFGVIPILQSKRNLKDDQSSVCSSNEQGAFRESVRSIARKLENEMAQKKAKVILVTSTAPGEGKSMISQNLAESFAHWGKKVVLIDGDLRKPVLYRRFGFKRENMSFKSVLDGNAPLDTVLRYKRDGKLALILNTVPVENPTVIINSSAMKKFIKSFANVADVVIVDTPPCAQLSDAPIFEQYADGILYVVQQDRMSIYQVEEAITNLCDSENKLLGYVLNGAQEVPQGYGKYSYGKYSYSKYGKYTYGKYGYGKYGSYGGSEPSNEEK